MVRREAVMMRRNMRTKLDQQLGKAIIHSRLQPPTMVVSKIWLKSTQ